MGLWLMASCCLLQTAAAEEIRGVLKRVDATRRTIKVSVDGKDRTYTVNADASIVEVRDTKQKNGKSVETLSPIESGLAGLYPGAKLTILTEKLDDKEAVTSVKAENNVKDNEKKADSSKPKKKKKKKS
jgi:hypothetical protein